MKEYFGESWEVRTSLAEWPFQFNVLAILLTDVACLEESTQSFEYRNAQKQEKRQNPLNTKSFWENLLLFVPHP